MTVEILLMADVKDLGTEGQVVRVSEGYARNFLIPRKLGAPVTEATRRRLAKIQQVREQNRKVEAEKALALVQNMEKGSYTIPVKTGAGEKLFGSVTNADIAEVLKAQGFEVDKHNIVLDNPIRELGVYEVKVKLHADVEATIKVWIVEE
jgi:large subunit ribosomal protein L9